MDFIDQIKQLAERAAKIKDSIQTEEATKTSIIMPFFQIMGYDVFNPLEFVPEYTADVGTKKGEKVDYAIMNENGDPLILIEAKWCGDNLDKYASQLYRYFSVTTAKFGILTNGLIYRFYTDLDELNKMDEAPFLEVNLLDLKENIVPELKKFTKSAFNIDSIMTTASQLKYGSLVRRVFEKQLNEPDDEFISFIISSFYEGRKTQNVLDEFRGIVKKSLSQFISDRINDRLKTALDREAAVQTPEEPPAENPAPADLADRIITTEEEIEGYFIIKTLLHGHLEGHELTYRDRVNYFAVLLDGKITKWVCRLYLSDRRKKIVFPMGEQSDIQLDSIEDLYNHGEELRAAVALYLHPKAGEQPAQAE